MGRVANSLLKVGEDNVTITEATGQAPNELSAFNTLMQTVEESLPVTTDTQVTTETEEVIADTESDMVQLNTYDEESQGASQQGASEFEAAVADAAELEAKWMLTFEQFVAGIQQEPELCQFFAEQNIIDLSGTCVDPILSQYTRTVLAAT